MRILKLIRYYSIVLYFKYIYKTYVEYEATEVWYNEKNDQLIVLGKAFTTPSKKIYLIDQDLNIYSVAKASCNPHVGEL